MSGLSIGGYKNKKTNEPSIIEMGSMTENAETAPSQEPVDNTPEQPVNADPVTEPTAEVTPSESLEVTSPVENNNNNTGVLEPVENISSLEPTVSEPVQPSTPQFTDQDALAYLSEKLGRQVNSLDDLKPLENPLEKDPYLKDLYDWRTRTNRPIEDFVKYQKDYSKLSDVQIAREILQHKYPTLNQAEIDLELSKYQPKEDDLESEVQMKNLELKKLATEGRSVLESMKVQFNEPLDSSQFFTPEVKSDLELAKQVKLQQSQNEQAQQEYINNLSAASSKTEKIQLQLSDDLAVNYKVSEDTRNNLPSYITEMPHWKNPDGSLNHQAIAEDGAKIKHFDEIIKLVFEQGVNTGKENLSKQANNTTLTKQTSNATQQVDGKSGIEIGGLDNFLGNKGMKIRRK